MIEELARHFFQRHTIYPFARPFWVALNREWIEAEARRYPRFGSALRDIALTALEEGFSEWVEDHPKTQELAAELREEAAEAKRESEEESELLAGFGHV